MRASNAALAVIAIAIVIVSSRRNTAAKMCFFDRMSRADLAARNASDHRSYRDRYVSSLRPTTAEERRRLRTLVEQVDAATRTTFPAIHGLPWKIVTTSADIEGGYPHTIGDTIVVPNPADITSETLLHEKVHVYQRFHPRETRELVVEKWGFRPIAVHGALPLARNNPDTDGTWYGYRGGPIVYKRYMSTLPRHVSEVALIGDVSDDVPEYAHAQKEHPFELMASVVAHVIMHGKRASQNVFERHAIEWLDHQRRLAPHDRSGMVSPEYSTT